MILVLWLNNYIQYTFDGTLWKSSLGFYHQGHRTSWLCNFSVHTFSQKLSKSVILWGSLLLTARRSVRPQILDWTQPPTTSLKLYFYLLINKLWVVVVVSFFCWFLFYVLGGKNKLAFFDSLLPFMSWQTVPVKKMKTAPSFKLPPLCFTAVFYFK